MVSAVQRRRRGETTAYGQNGTAAGTQELTGISGANSAGINPTDFVGFNGEVLFNGVDASGNVGLWATNGSAAGTEELASIGGADTAGSTLPT